jgi:hypothetical protein
MRILQIDSGKSLRGGQLQVLRLLEGLAEQRVEARLMARAGSPLEREATARGFETRPLNWSALRRESRWADIVHCHDAHAHTLAWLASRAPFVVSRRVAFPVKKSWFSARKYAAARLFLCVSKSVMQALREAGIPDARLRLVYDGVDVPPVAGTRSGAIVALDSADPGKCGALLRQLSAEIEFSGDLRKSFETARMFLYPTLSEGLGSAALLAMAYGVPVVASGTGGLCEIVKHGETGLLAGNTAAEFQAAIAQLEGREELARRIVRNARSMIERDFTAQRMIHRTMECYREVVR